MKELWTCEACHKKTEAIVYHDGYLVIEEHYKCEHCGYEKSWAYGVDLLSED